MSNSRRSVILGAGPGEEGKDTRKKGHIFQLYTPSPHFVLSPYTHATKHREFSWDESNGARMEWLFYPNPPLAAP